MVFTWSQTQFLSKYSWCTSRTCMHNLILRSMEFFNKFTQFYLIVIIHTFKIQTNTHLSQTQRVWKRNERASFAQGFVISDPSFLFLNLACLPCTQSLRCKFLFLRIVKSTPLKRGKSRKLHCMRWNYEWNKKQIADKYTRTWHEHREIKYFHISPPWWIREAQCLKYVLFCCGFSAI